jgi:RNase H-fold protein (predicted Holliday junction resolvase)
MYLGLDPGRQKCGLAVMEHNGTIHLQQVVETDRALSLLQHVCQNYPIEQVIMGDQTGSKTWRQTLEITFPQIPVVAVDERYSSLEARDRYWQMYPPRGLTRLIPVGMRQPPRAIDDIVAILLIERYLKAAVPS